MLKEEASSSAVATESLFLSRAIDTKGNCSVMPLDNLKAFSQHGMPESSNGTALKISRVLVWILHEIAPEACWDFIAYDKNNNKISYDSMLKLLCQMIETLILCYKKFTRDVPKTKIKMILFVCYKCTVCVTSHFYFNLTVNL